MYTQLFGSYLLSKNIITNDEFVDAMAKVSESKSRLGTIALMEGLMTANEVDECLLLQTREDKRFGEIAVERGYLTDMQVAELLRKQSSDFYILGQVLVESGIFTNEDFERLVFDYKAENEMYDLELDVENLEVVDTLIQKFFILSETPESPQMLLFLKMLFNSLIRFIGDDFTPLSPIDTNEYAINYAVSQKMTGKRDYNCIIDMDRDTAIEFASRYAGDSFSEFDEYVQASLEDFLNLQNGLFVVNVSNEDSQELTLSPPEVLTGSIVRDTENMLILPVLYSFGTIHMIVKF